MSFPDESVMTQVGDLRIAHVEEGEGPPVVFLHGEPTWSYLWRGVWPHVAAAGFRCLVPDMAGFGRSDKPTDLGWYSYDRHVEVMAGWLSQHVAPGDDATIVVHDWGGPVGLRLFVEHPDVFSRAVVMDTGLFTGHQRMSEPWQAFRSFVEATEDLPVGFLVDGGTKRALSDAERAMYDAPFAGGGPASKAGARAFPLMIPLTPDGPGAAAGQRVQAALADDRRDKLVLWAAEDPILPLSVGRKFAALLGVAEDDVVVVPDAAHFLQEDQPDLIGRAISDWLTEVSSPMTSP